MVTPLRVIIALALLVLIPPFTRTLRTALTPPCPKGALCE